MAWRTDSLESHLALAFLTCALLPVVAAAIVVARHGPWQWMVAALAAALFMALALRGVYVTVITTFRRIGLQLDAMQIQDFGVRAKPTYPRGKVVEIHRQLDTVREALGRQRRNQDEQALLVHRLVDQLNTPIVIFNERLKLSYANPAFADLFGRPWETARNASPALLGLENHPEWHLTDPQQAQQWQIRHSLFWDQGHSQQLLVFIDIRNALRQNQLQAWHNLIRVLSHEIRNSLTPVVALVQSLQLRCEAERDRQALLVVDERCRHLQDFVRRYSELHSAPNVRLESFSAQGFFKRIAELFPDAHLQEISARALLSADPILLEQVLINLLRNSLEAGSPPTTTRVTLRTNEHYSEIRIIDRGRGIAHPDNLFVPFYSTKPHGQGIGLSLSRLFVEQMGGTLTLRNNPDGVGACATICLPRAVAASRRPIPASPGPESDA